MRHPLPPPRACIMRRVVPAGPGARSQAKSCISHRNQTGAARRGAHRSLAGIWQRWNKEASPGKPFSMPWQAGACRHRSCQQAAETRDRNKSVFPQLSCLTSVGIADKNSLLPAAGLHGLGKQPSNAALFHLPFPSQVPAGDAPERGKSLGGCRFMPSGGQGPALLRAGFWLVGPSWFQATFTPKIIPTGCLSLSSGPDPTTH